MSLAGSGRGRGGGAHRTKKYNLQGIATVLKPTGSSPVSCGTKREERRVEKVLQFSTDKLVPMSSREGTVKIRKDSLSDA